MIKADRIVIEKTTEDKSYIRADLLCDTKEEIEAMGTNGSAIEGFSDNTVLTAFSTAFTKKQELGVLGSDNIWVW